jgi:hypothetical protein
MRRKRIQFPKYYVTYNAGQWAKPTNPAITAIIIVSIQLIQCFRNLEREILTERTQLLHNETLEHSNLGSVLNIYIKR